MWKQHVKGQPLEDSTKASPAGRLTSSRSRVGERSFNRLVKAPELSMSASNLHQEYSVSPVGLIPEESSILSRPPTSHVFVHVGVDEFSVSQTAASTFAGHNEFSVSRTAMSQSGHAGNNEFSVSRAAISQSGHAGNNEFSVSHAAADGIQAGNNEFSMSHAAARGVQEGNNEFSVSHAAVGGIQAGNNEFSVSRKAVQFTEIPDRNTELSVSYVQDPTMSGPDRSVAELSNHQSNDEVLTRKDC